MWQGHSTSFSFLQMTNVCLWNPELFQEKNQKFQNLIFWIDYLLQHSTNLVLQTNNKLYALDFTIQWGNISQNDSAFCWMLLSAILLSAILLNVNLLSVILLNVILLNVILLNVILLDVILLNIILLNVFLLTVFL